MRSGWWFVLFLILGVLNLGIFYVQITDARFASGWAALNLIIGTYCMARAAALIDHT